MLGLYLNCRGVGKKGFAFCLKDLIDEFRFDSIGLQETMKRVIDASMWRKFDPDGVYLWHWSPSIGRSGGILCGTKSSRFDICSATTEKHFVKAILLDKKIQKQLMLVVAYGAAHDEGKHEFLASLANICSQLSMPTVIGGDFNIIRYASKKIKRVGLQNFQISLILLLAIML